MRTPNAPLEAPPLNKAVLDVLNAGGRMTRSRSGKREIRIRLDGDMEAELSKQSRDDNKPSLAKSIMNTMNSQDIHRLAFEADPSATNQYKSLYKVKERLIPDKILKRLAIQDDLVACIVQARSNQMSAFGRPRPNRHSMGFAIEPLQEALEKIEENEDQQAKAKAKKELDRRIAEAMKRLMTCGDPRALGIDDKLTFPEYISQSVRNALVVGRIATEVVWVDGNDGKKKFSCFRVIDAGTIYKAAPQQEAAESVRRQARMLLEQLHNKKLEPERFQRDEFAWVQVIEDRPVQAFTAKECVVRQFYHVPDVELDGYPVTPLDTVISAVTTHLNITVHNKLYFQSGRATRGMLIIKSDDVDESIVSRVRQQFNASINSVNCSWRMPVFGIGAEDEMEWQPIDTGSRDMEFQYLSDMNARTILSAFQMSPDELPGWSYLSRGTNNQAMSESNNEYRLEAHRDLGIRPLLAQFEDFLNQNIFPLLDEELSKIASIKLVGLDSETEEKEINRIQQNMQVHMTMDDILEKVEKKALGKAWGGEFQLNPLYQTVLDKYFTVGEIKEHFFGIQGASKDPAWAYARDPFYQANTQRMDQLQAQQAQMQAQQQQQAAGGAPGGQPGGGGDGGGGDGAPGGGGASAGPPERQEASTENQKSAAQESSSAQGQGASGGQDLSRSADQAIGLLTQLSKSEKQLPESKRKLLTQQKETLAFFLKGWQDDLAATTAEVMRVAAMHAPKKPKPRA